MNDYVITDVNTHETFSIDEWICDVINFNFENFKLIKHKDITNNTIYLVSNKYDVILYVASLNKKDVCKNEFEHIVRKYIRDKKIEHLTI